MSRMTVFAFKMEPELKAMLEMEALRRRITQGTLLREALSVHLKDYQGGEMNLKKREREINLARPLDLHDGVMFVSRVRDIIKKQKDTIKGWRPLEPQDYDHFLNQVISEKEVAETYEHKEWLLRELDRLVRELQEEKERMQ